MCNKVAQGQALLADKNPDIFAVTETWLNSSINSNEFFNDEYQVFRKDRHNRKGGGILIALKNSLNM